jgi:serine/threonine protein kinase/tetratricopeptide (TPR) repeat protein
MNDPPKRDVVIFTEAVRLPSHERAAYLDRACGGDAKLRQQIEALLQIQAGVGDFLEQSPQKVTPQTRLGVSAGEKPGDHIDRFKLLEQIGEGGCGVVYMAEQEEPVRRRVALKLIKLGMDTKQVVARFEAERQALALMDHPHIAKVLDAGATESGRPYFVMELVHGIKITEYCDKNSLSTEERLKIFVQVCQAVQHAHQKGIIHRDIKPSNILVNTTTEGEAFPVVIDFGIAKATNNQPLTDKTLFTAFEMFIGTPAYMSPEQAALTNVDVDTRTDIYSLGVLLYELLTGSTPFSAGELLNAGLDEVRRVIREQEPVRPSTRLSKMTAADLTSIAQHRKSEPPKLIRSVCGDLDWIAMKALEKDPGRRYATAHGLALDIQHFLTDDVVSARPPSAAYKLQKAIRRNKLAFTTAGLVTAALLLGLAASIWQAVRATHAEKRVTAERDAKEQALKDAEAISTFLTEVFQSPDPARDGRTIAVAEMLDRATKKLETTVTNQPDRRVKLQATLGATYQALGLYPEAIPLQEKVLAYQRRGPEHLGTLTAMTVLARTYYDTGRLDEALKIREEALPLSRRILGPKDPSTLLAMNDLAVSYYSTGRKDESLKMHEEVLSLSRTVLGPEHPNTLFAMNDLAATYFNIGRNDEALKMQEEVLSLSRTVLGLEHPETLVAMNNLAVTYLAVGRKDEALKLTEELLPLERKVFGPEHSKTLTAMNNLAAAYFAVGRKDEALKMREESLTLCRKVLGPDHPKTVLAIKNLAISYMDANRKDEAIKLREEVLKVNQEQLALALKRDPKSSASAYSELGFTLDALGHGDDAIKAWQEAVRIEPANNPNVHYWLGKALMDRQRFAEALPILRATRKFYPDGDRGMKTDELLALAESMVQNGNANPGDSRRAPSGESRTAWLAKMRAGVAANPDDADKGKHLATVCLWLGETNEYQALCRKLIDVATSSRDPAAQDRAAKACLIGAQLNKVILKQAVAAGRQALALSSPNDPNRLWFQVTAAMAALRDGAPAEAEPLLTGALQDPKDIPERRGLALAFRAMARVHLGRTNEARADFEEMKKTMAPFPSPPAISAIVTLPDQMAVHLAYIEVKTLLQIPATAAKP